MILCKAVINSDATWLTLPTDAQILDAVASANGSVITIFYTAERDLHEIAKHDCVRIIPVAVVVVGDKIPEPLESSPNRPINIGFSRFLFMRT